MSQCKLWLGNYSGQYYPGSVIQGKVILNFSGETTLRAIKIRVICHEHTEWIGTERYYDESKNEHANRDTLFKGDNDVISTEIILYGSNAGSTTLSMGQHIYPFTFPLPPNLPSTYQCDKGSIVYKITAIVDRPLALDYEDQFIFVINSPVDLNLLHKPELLQPTSHSDDKTVCCWCCAQGPISMDVELPKRTLVPMETIEIKVRLCNMSNTNIEGVTLDLKQRLIYKVTEPNNEEREDDNILANLKDVGLGAHGENTYSFKLTLPEHVFIPNFSQCRLFKTEHVYQLVAKLPSVHKNLEILMYPEVGHIEIGQQGQPASGDISMTGGYNAQNPAIPPSGFLPGDSSMQYPTNTMGWVATPAVVPSAPAASNGYNPKADEAFRNQGDSNTSQPEQPPPSYDSINQY